MPIVRSLLVLTGFALWAVFHIQPAAAAPPALAVLEYRSGLFGSSAPIYDRPGASASPYANKPRKIWTLHEGDTLRQTTPPPERLIRFYETVHNNTLSVCTVIVKYSRAANGWRPGYQLLIHPIATIESGKLKPLGSDEGARGLVQLVHPAAPNREGFYHTLSFGLTTIDAWEIQ
jgi:hypothetical protein